MDSKRKVSIVRCKDYDSLRVYESVKKATDLLGGMSNFVQKGDNVLLKPNLLSARAPESGVDTHPEFVRAIVRLVRESGGNPKIGDTPGGSVKRMDDVYEKSGMKKMADEEGVELLNFDRIEDVRGIPIASFALESDLVITIPKFKTHSLMTLTGAVKNVFGVVPGLFKTNLHRSFPNYKNFASVIVDIYSIIKPGLAIMDGITAMEGEGPASGDLRNIGLVMASNDPVSLDAVLSTIVCLNPFDIETTRLAHDRRLGMGDLNNIEIIGEKVESVRCTDFNLPKTALLYKVPNPITRAIAKRLKFKIAVHRNDCTRCSICVKSCPARAMSMDEKKGVVINHKVCIFCLCCHEFCPKKSIYVKESMLAKIVRT